MTARQRSANGGSMPAVQRLKSRPEVDCLSSTRSKSEAGRLATHRMLCENQPSTQSSLLRRGRKGADMRFRCGFAAAVAALALGAVAATAGAAAPLHLSQA